MFSGFQEANAGFRTLLTKSTQQLNALSKKLGSCIEKARPYYEALEEYKNAQESCQEAAVQYQRTSGQYIWLNFQQLHERNLTIVITGNHRAAKETIALAEQRFLSQKHEWKFDSAWQEMLNQATFKVRARLILNCLPDLIVTFVR